MNIVNNVFWITDREIDLLRATAALPFSLGGFDSLDSILTTLRVDVILEPGVIESQDYIILEKNLEFWKKAAERLKRHRERNAYSEELYQEALRNIEELNYELRVCPNYLLRGMYSSRKNVIKLYPDEMQQEYGGQRMNELLISTLAHEAMHAYFNRREGEKYPNVFHVEEPLAEFGMLLWLHETDCGGGGYYQWAYDDVRNKKNCYRYGAKLMDQHLKAKPKSQERCYLEKYRIRLSPNTMLSVHNGTVSLPERGEILPSVKIEGYRSFWPRWDNVYEYPPRYYYDEETDTLCLDGYWDDISLTNAPDIVIEGKSEVFMFSPAVKHVYLGPLFCTNDIRHVYPICLCPVYVSPMNRVYAEVNNIPVFKKNNKPVLPSLGEGLYKINRDGKWGVIDDNLKQVIPCKYDDIHIDPQGTYTVKKDGEEYTVDKFGNRIDNKS